MAIEKNRGGTLMRRKAELAKWFNRQSETLSKTDLQNHRSQKHLSAEGDAYRNLYDGNRNSARYDRVIRRRYVHR